MRTQTIHHGHRLWLLIGLGLLIVGLVIAFARPAAQPPPTPAAATPAVTQ